MSIPTPLLKYSEKSFKDLKSLKDLKSHEAEDLTERSLIFQLKRVLAEPRLVAEGVGNSL